MVLWIKSIKFNGFYRNLLRRCRNCFRNNELFCQFGSKFNFISFKVQKLHFCNVLHWLMISMSSKECEYEFIACWFFMLTMCGLKFLKLMIFCREFYSDFSLIIFQIQDNPIRHINPWKFNTLPVDYSMLIELSNNFIANNLFNWIFPSFVQFFDMRKDLLPHFSLFFSSRT